MRYEHEDTLSDVLYKFPQENTEYSIQKTGVKFATHRLINLN